MVSIRERDVVALSQSNITVKGFVLALQLVMVETVLALTEVVQESCSSSEADSEDEVFNPSDRFGKKQTLNPAHARLDKTDNVSYFFFANIRYCCAVLFTWQINHVTCCGLYLGSGAQFINGRP